MNHYSIERLIESGSDSDRKVIAFCGAGGKTSGIHAIRDYCLAKNKTVLVTTTTHMFLEEGCVSLPCEKQDGSCHYDDTYVPRGGLCV